ncbi:hypothetical protein [Ancylomarina sp. 16SWW S1-10-2]|uniref:hypothetical protein n=1 Tax=Ancylomarina sp. 16SWW S1-10-2 TaxID=2499681 RepID=UPI0012AE04BA|nr:hypothetical protein [Ancylomarina sp. 16SWW S1-10-2]MRT93136.1 hypothetical protein [Ancylomarina sp. 16SWW S1-10-2]
MKQIQIITLMFLMISSSILFAQEQKKVNNKTDDASIQAAYMKINKKSIDNAKPMIEFLLKYDEKDSTKAPKQADFDLLMKQMGLNEEIKNDGSGLTKEDAFQFINAYINAEDNIGKEKPTQPNINTESELQKELKKAEELFENAMPEMEKMIKEAQKEAEKIKINPDLIPYSDFKEKAKQMKPELSESEIRAAYDELMKNLGYTN